MIQRDNADDYLDGGILALQAWTLLGDVDCPPSFEVFEFGWRRACKERRQLVTMGQYAHALVARYERTDADRKQKQPWWRYNEFDGRLKPT